MPDGWRIEIMCARPDGIKYPSVKVPVLLTHHLRVIEPHQDPKLFATTLVEWVAKLPV